MVQDKDMNHAFQERLTAINNNPNYTILANSKDEQLPKYESRMAEYLIYTDYFSDKRKVKTNSIFIFTPESNVDKFGHPKADYVNQLLFETNLWDKTVHITVIETLGAESRLAFYDFQNHGIAQMALRALLSIAHDENITQISGNVSSFDRDDIKKAQHILEKNGFQFNIQNEQVGTGIFSKKLS